MTRPLIAAALLFWLAQAVSAQQTGDRSGGGEEELPAPFEALTERLNLANLHRKYDAARGEDVTKSSKPLGPELPLAVFFETVRPLGSLKYENQLNYFASAYTGGAPTLQTATYEYVFADWNAARVEIVAPAGSVEALGFGYQRTFGVGRRANWAHGALVLPEISINGSGFVGGTALYTAAWKPERESPFTFGGSVGANRASMANRPLSGADPGVGSLGMGMGLGTPARRGDDEARVWRTLAAGNAWYNVNKKVTVGIELDAFAHREFGEYVALAHLTYRPVKHFFAQFGTGWYEIGGNGQAVFVVRLNLLNPSGRTAGGEGGR